MPELPEVETFRRYIEAGALGKMVTSAHLDGIKVIGDVLDVPEALIGRRIVTTRRNGKSLFIGLDDGRWLLIHFGMSGQPLFFEDDPPRFARLVMVFEDRRLAICWQRRLGSTGIIRDVDAYLASKGRAEDALSIDPASMTERIRGRRSIKSVLLDQSVVSGIGNLYADEILFQLGIDPRRPASELTEEEKGKIHSMMNTVLMLSIERETDFSSFPDNMLLPHRYKDCACPTCQTPWDRYRIGGRTTYSCHNCQH